MRYPTHNTVLKLAGFSKSKLNDGIAFTGTQANLQVIDIELCQTVVSKEKWVESQTIQ